MNLGNKFIFVLLLILPVFALSQATKVSGTVTDEETLFFLPDISVKNQTTAEEVFTGMDGDYEIEANIGDLLVFTADGYQDRIVTYTGRPVLDVLMQPRSSVSLNEVIIIGYGATTHKDATGAVTNVTEKDFNQGFATAPEQLLTGKVAGLQITTGGGAPGTGSMIRIRGGSSLNASNDPLFVVDGVPMDNGQTIAGSSNPLNYINPSDIESISVLKDASATAIYGARASNGVIIITTKKAKGKRLRVSLNSSVSVFDRINQIDVLSAAEFTNAINSMANDNVKPLLGEANTNWQNEIFKTAFGYNTDVSISGTIGDVLPFRLSIGHTDEDGILKTGNFQRTTAALNLSPSFLNKHLDIDFNIRGAYEENQFADDGAIGAALRMDPTKPVYSGNDAFGGYWEWLNNEGNPNPNATRNPLALLMLRDNHSYVNRSVGNIKFDYKLHGFEDLKAVLNLGYDYSKGKGSNTVPEFARMNYVEGDDGELIGGFRSDYIQFRRNYLLDFYLNYAKEIASINSRVDLTAGYSYQSFDVDDRALEGNFAHSNITLDKNNPYDRILIGFFGRLDYTFNDKYLLTATIRRDGSSRFSPDARWGWFPSVALAWNIAEEGFLKDSKTVSNMKLRLGWGITGQENLEAPYPYLPLYTSSLNQYAYYPVGDTYVPIIRPNIYDANLKWEEQTTWNIGLDFGFFGNRLWGSVDVYKKETKDMLQTVAAPLPNLNNLITTNIGTMENRGVEIGLGADIVRNENFKWTLNANATFNENEITKISGASSREFYLTGGISGGVGNTVLVNMVGVPAYSFYVFEQVYDENGKPIQGAYVDQNGDGVINDADLRPFHSGRPDWTFGLSSNMNWKNWDFGFSMRASLGNYLYNNIASDIGTYAAVRGTNGYLSNIQADALNSGFNNNEYFTDYYVQNASFLKMDYITLGYTFRDFIEGASMRFYGTVQNVFTITEYDGLDPEVGSGIDNNFYPRPRIFTLGVNVNF